MRKEPVSTTTAPAAIGPYSQAFIAGDLLFCSGQIPIDPATNKLVDGDTATQAEQVCKNVLALLASQGLTAANVVKTTVFLADIKDFPVVNEVYARHFPQPSPARSCIAVAALPLGAKVEIEAIALR
ncbi:MAG: RidA family protein [Desulfovibrio sp.]|jgi:2-iminobutanoate/2-iminopropanoate deaminase|nr:RidA family protein [Desulfovibrio sp.]